jgi:hypothetical protein
MMVPKKSLALAGAALVFGVTASAQSIQVETGKQLRHLNKPLKAASLDLATGTVTKGGVVGNRGASTTADFQNLDFNGFAGVDTGSGACRWVGHALKGTGANQSTNASDLMTNIVFAYCSASLDPDSGGPGGTASLAFYEGYTLFGGAPTTTVAAFTLTGMPANTITTAWNVTNACYLFTVNFLGLVSFRDSNSHQGIGYSWTFEDLDTGGILASTFPFLSCQTSCSNILFNTDGQGQLDAIDQYCVVPANPLGLPQTFTFGTITVGGSVTGAYTTIMMQVQEATDLGATADPYNSVATPNADTLSATSAVVGGSWTATWSDTDLSNTNGANVTVRVRRNRSTLNGTNPPPPLPGSAGRVMISGPLLATYGTASVGEIAVVNEPVIPLDFGFICVHWAAQAQAGGGGIRLSSAVDGTIGTF